MNFAIGFDFDHTLGVDNRLERSVMLAQLHEIAAVAGVVVDLAAAEIAVETTLHAYRHGFVGVEDGVGSFFTEFVPGHATETLDAAALFRERVVAEAPAKIEPIAGALDMLSALDGLGVRYALLTNGWSPLQETKARLLKWQGGVFVSERIGARKPTREAFDVLADHLELPLAQIWYVGDDPETDCGGALAAGMTSVWFDWEGRAYPSELPRPTHTIHALSELVPLVQGQMAETTKRA